MTTTAVSGQRDEAYVKGFIDAVWRDCAANNVAVASAMIARMARDHAPSLAVHCRQLIATQGGRAALACREALAILDGIAPAPRPIMPVIAPIAEASKILTCRLSDTNSLTLELDPEVGRLCLALGFTIPLRLWVLASGMARAAGGCGWVEERALIDAATAAGMGTAKNLRNTLIKGMKDEIAFWQRDGGRIYITGYKRLAAALVALTMTRGQDHLVVTNPPGCRFITVKLEASARRWNATLYNAWHMGRDQHTNGISRLKLRELFNVSTKTLIAWERAMGIEATKGYAVITDITHIRKWAFPIVRRMGNGALMVGAMRRVSNRYEYPLMRERQHRRTPKHVRYAMRRLIDNTASRLGHGMIGQPSQEGVAIPPTGRISFERTNSRKADVVSDRFKSVRKHLQRAGDDHVSHYALIDARGKRQSVLIFEQTSGQPLSGGYDRVTRKEEDTYFAANGGRCGWYQYLQEAAAHASF